MSVVAREESLLPNEVHEREEVERLRAILAPVIKEQDKKLYALLPIAKNVTRRYELKAKLERGDVLRDWAKERYWELYPGVKGPRLASIDTAYSIVVRGYDVQLPTSASGRGRGRPPASNQFAELEDEIAPLASAKMEAREAGVFYYVVPYQGAQEQGKPGLTGVWRIGDKRPVHLLDASILVKRLKRPYALSKGIDYTVKFIAVNTQGVTKEFVADRENLENKGLDAKFEGFAPFPRTKLHRDYLLDAFSKLMREEHVIVQDEQESEGYHQAPAPLGLVYMLNNGIETQNVPFIPSDDAPFVPPEIKAAGNGYAGTAKDIPLADEIWDLFLERLNPLASARRYAKIGAIGYALFPPGTIEDAGRGNFVIETVGSGSGQGKTAEENYHLSVLGVDFKHELGTYLSESSTYKGRLLAMSKMNHLVYTDFDRKDSPGERAFEEQHASRKDMINLFADGDGGGVVSSRDGLKERARANPRGIPLLTGNCDHAPFSVQRKEHPVEYRVCTFVLQKDEKADDDISKAIEPRREEFYAWGRAFRQWIMRKYNEDKHAFTLFIQALKQQAEAYTAAYEWPHTRQRNQCIDLIWGVLFWQSFLQEERPGCLLYQLLETYRDIFLDDRQARAQYVQSLIAGGKGNMEVHEFALEALRYALGASHVYVVSQQDAPLEPDDFPLSLTYAGMKHGRNYEGGEKWDTGQTKIGYYQARKEAIAFMPEMLYKTLSFAAEKQKYPFPSKEHFKKVLAEAGVSIVKRDESGEPIEDDSFVCVKRKNMRAITIPLSVLYPDMNTDEADTVDEDEEEYQQTADEARSKIIPLHSTQDNQAPAPRIVTVSDSDEILDDSL